MKDWEILSGRLKTLSEKNEVKDEARNGLGIVDGSEVVCLQCIKEFMFFSEETFVGDLRLDELNNCIVFYHELLVYDIGLLLSLEFYSLRQNG